MAETIRELRDLDDDQVIARHDERATSTVVGTSHYLAELERLDSERTNQRVLSLTEQMRDMTKQARNVTSAVGVLTLVNVILVGIQVAVS